MMMLMMMIAVALPLVAIAVVCWIIAGRVDLKRKIKGWSGERSTLAETEGARRQIFMLRAAAVACVVLAVLGIGALKLMTDYIAYGVR